MIFARYISRMKKIFLLLVLVAVTSLCYSQNAADTIIDPVKAEKAKVIVQQYLQLWVKGTEMDSLTALCAVPFAWDRKEIISDIRQLKTELTTTRSEKGLLAFTIDTVYVKKVKREIIDVVVPIDIYYVVARVRRKGSRNFDGVLFAVQMTTEPKVVGISD